MALRTGVLTGFGLLTTLALAGCGALGVSVSSGADESAAASAPADAAASAEADADGEDESASPAAVQADGGAEPGTDVDDLTPAFGQTVTWHDGLKLTISEDEVVKMAKDSAADNCQPGDDVQTFRVSVENGTPETFDPEGPVGVEGVIGYPDGRDGVADMIFMSGPDLGAMSTHMSKVRPGKTGTILMGFCMPEPDVEYILQGNLASEPGALELDRTPVTFSRSGEDKL